MDIRCLGPLTAHDGERQLRLGGPRQRLVLAHLLVNAGRMVATEALIDAVWPTDPPRSARNTVQTYASHLRRALGAARLEGHGQGYRLHLGPDELDAARFERRVTEARTLIDRDPHTAAAALSEALALWRGTPFADLLAVAAGSLDGEAARLEELRRQAVETRLAAELGAGRHTDAIGELEALVAADPLRERLWALLMLAQYRAGRQSEALSTYGRLRALLAEEVGLEPSGELRTLQQRILRQDPDLSIVGRREGPHAWPAADAIPSQPGVTPPLPTLLHTEHGIAYVGRSELLDRLRRDRKAALAGGASRVVLLAGEPGIGKTRTATIIAREAHADGALVLAGRCDEELAVPFQPFMEALDHQTQHAVELPLGRLPGELVRLLPDLPTRRPELPPPIDSDPRVEEHRLYDAVASWLVSTSQDRGLVLVLDDLHAATATTLRLLLHVVRTSVGHPEASILLLATYRDTEVDAPHPLATTLAELRRLPNGSSVHPVERLSLDDVGAFVRELGDDVPADRTDQLADVAFAHSNGNPFFLREVLRHYLETGAVHLDEDPSSAIDPTEELLPDGVRDVLRRRLHGVGDHSIEVLRYAAVVGPEAELPVLAELMDRPEEALLDALDDAARAGLVEEVAPDRYRFTHALVRNALLADLSASRRRRMHAAITDVLEAIGHGDVVALARHAIAAVPAGGRDRAIGYATTAGQLALARRAVAEAVDWFTRACELADGHDEVDVEVALRARCGLGEAQRDAGDQRYRATLLTAAEAALAAGHLDLAVRAAVANHRATTVSTIGTVDRERVATLERVHGQLGDDRSIDDPASAARIRALLSLEMTFDDTQHDRRLRLADDALDLARSTDDPTLEAWVATTTRIPVTVPERVPTVAEVMRRAVEQADRSGDPALRCTSRVSGHQAHLGIGEVATARRMAEQAVALAEEEGAPFLQVLARFNAVQYRAYTGDLAAARTANHACLTFSQEVGETDTTSWWAAIAGLLAVVDGTLPQLSDQIGAFAATTPDLPAWRAVHVLALTLGGEREQALALIDRYELRRPGTLRRDWLTASGWTNLAQAAVELRDAELGEMLAAVTAPYRDQWAHVNVFCQGPLELTFGLACEAAGRRDEAVAALRRAREALRDRGLRSHVPWASMHLGRALSKQGSTDARREAIEVLTAARSEATELSMPAIGDRLDAFLEQVS